MKRQRISMVVLVYCYVAALLVTTGLATTDEDQYYSYSPECFVSSFRALRDEIIAEQLPQDNNADGGKENVCSTGGQNKNLVVAAIQLTSTPSPVNDARGFWNRAKEAVQDAAENQNATLVLLPELFLGPYFCQSQEASLLGLADSVQGNFIITEFQKLAKTYNVVLPISIFERKNNAHYNSVVMIDADGTILGTYRKSHIPDGTGYQEKFYFSPGDTGFKVFHTQVGQVGVGICWDQWFPEAARSMALLGADVLLYPTAIGSEPQDPTINSADHWQRVMQGHAAANMVPVVASNRYGTEVLLHQDGTEKQRIHFYGRTFITDETGAISQEAKDGSDVLVATIDKQANRETRAAWGLFRDRRPELYGILRTKDGELKHE